MKRPDSYKINVDRWEQRVPFCSVLTLGMYQRLALLAFRSNRRGYLMLGHSYMTCLDASTLLRASVDDVRSAITELLGCGAIDETPDGCLYIPDMVNEERERSSARIRQANSRAGPVTAESRVSHAGVTVMSQKCHKSDPSGPRADGISLTPGREEKIRKDKEPPLPPCGGNEALQAVMCRWLKYKEQRREKYTPIGLESLEKRFIEMGVDRARAAVDYTTSNGWKGLHEPNSPSGPKSDVPTQSAFVFKPREQAQETT